MFDPTAHLDEHLQEIERKSHIIVGMGDSSPPLSTGNLALDFVTGGMRPGWYTNAGGEQSAKTTSAISTAISAAKQGVPLVYFFDYEGSTGNSQDYVANIASQIYGKKMSVETLFGRRDEATGEWSSKPIIRYVPESVGERFFDVLKRTIDILPDKVYLGKKWYYVYEDNKANAKYKAHEVPGMAKKYGKGIYIEAKDGSLQAVFLTDSYPAMNPEANDEEEADRSLALTARFFSKHIPRVKGALVRKRIMVLGMNQIREKPMVMYGPTQDEPGGQALKFYCFSSDTLLQTDKGLLTALEVSQTKVHKLAGEKGLERLGLWKSTGLSPIYAATTSAGYQVRGKPGHKVLAFTTQERFSLKPKWERLSRLSPSKGRTYLALRVPDFADASTFPQERVDINFEYSHAANNQYKEDPIVFPLCENVAELLGLVVSEGYSKDYTLIITNHNPEILNRAEFLLGSIGFKGKTKRGPNSVSVNSASLCAWLASIKAGGVLSRFKEVPRCVRQSPMDVQVAFLKGLFSGDGYFSKREAVYHSLSNTLLEQVQMMLLSLGIVCSRKDYVPKNTDNRLDLTENEHRVSLNSLLQTELDTANLEVFRSKFNFGSLYFCGTGYRRLANLLKGERNDAGTFEQEFKYSSLPPLFTLAQQRRTMTKFYEWFAGNILKGRKYWKLSMFYEGWFADYEDFVSTLRTSHERQRALRVGKSIKEFIEYTRDRNLVWLPLTKVDLKAEQATFDCNVPGTSTVVTNGILSHNSDVRVWHTSRALSAVEKFKPVGKGQIEKERCVSGEGEDTYRYVHLKGKKNKLGLPNIEAFIRIWVEDSGGVARGLDPVFDTVWYLHVTGQLSMRGRKTMRVNLGKIGESSTFTWRDMKLWVLGNKKQKKAVCEKIGLKKAIDIRSYCFSQIRSKEAWDLYAETNKGKVKKEEDED